MTANPAPVDVTAETFGRDASLFHGLLGFMATVSLALWALVLLTAVVRFVACNVLYRPRRLQAPQLTLADPDEA
jgi:hypothetical protein